MRNITLELPDRPFENTELSDLEIANTLRLLAAAKLYEMGNISSGRAAELAGISRVAFLNESGRYNVSPFQITPNELKAEVEGLHVDLDGSRNQTTD